MKSGTSLLIIIPYSRLFIFLFPLLPSIPCSLDFSFCLFANSSSDSFVDPSFSLWCLLLASNLVLSPPSFPLIPLFLSDLFSLHGFKFYLYAPNTKFIFPNLSSESWLAAVSQPPPLRCLSASQMQQVTPKLYSQCGSPFMSPQTAPLQQLAPCPPIPTAWYQHNFPVMSLEKHVKSFHWSSFTPLST